MLHAIVAVLTVAVLVFPCREVSSAVQPMTDAFRLARTPCASASVCPQVSVSESVRRSACVRVYVCVCACVYVCVRFPPAR